jgi:hypothetical protein
MAKELGRKLGKRLVADGWQDKVLGALWREELFGGQTWKLRTIKHTSSAMLSVALPGHRVAVISSFSIVRQQQ